MNEEKLREVLDQSIWFCEPGMEDRDVETLAEHIADAIKSSGLTLCDTSTHIVVPRWWLETVRNDMETPLPDYVDQASSYLKAAEAGE